MSIPGRLSARKATRRAAHMIKLTETREMMPEPFAGSYRQSCDDLRFCVTLARTHPPPLSRTPGLLARLLRRRARRHDRDPHVFRTMKTLGAGFAVSTRAANRASILTERPSPSIRRAPILSAHGKCFCRSGPRPISRHGVISAIGPSANTRCGKEASGCRRRCRVRL